MKATHTSVLFASLSTSTRNCEKHVGYLPLCSGFVHHRLLRCCRGAGHFGGLINDGLVGGGWEEARVVLHKGKGQCKLLPGSQGKHLFTWFDLKGQNHFTRWLVLTTPAAKPVVHGTVGPNYVHLW